MRLIAFTILVFSGALVMASAGLMDTLDSQGEQQTFGFLLMLLGGALTTAELFVTGFFGEVKNSFNQRRPAQTPTPVERRPEV